MTPDHRILPTRRKADIEAVAGLGAIIVLLLAGGVAWGTSQAALNQKLDRAEFAAHAAAVVGRAREDSIGRAILADAVARIERKQDSTNARLSRLICNRQPTYCQ